MHNSDARAVTFELLDALGDMEQDLGSLKSVLLGKSVLGWTIQLKSCMIICVCRNV